MDLPLHLPRPGEIPRDASVTARNVSSSDVSMLAELALHGKFAEIPQRLFHRRFDPATTTILMDASVSTDRVAAYGTRQNMRTRIRLYTHRFARVARAPIGAYERACVCAYLLRRLLRVRHGLVRGALRLVRRG